jgi:hypothetical protein
MANCSIPNLNPASGRISMRSLRRSRRRNNQRTASILVISRRGSLQKRRYTAALQSVLHARRIRRWTLDVGRSVFSAIRRVKGAWWPSRSSKPSSPRKSRGRFDSYPLRLFIFDFRLPIADWPAAGQGFFQPEIEDWAKGGEPDVA